MSKTIRVLLVGGCPTLRVGLRTILEQTPDIAVVGEAGEAGELEQIKTLQPDVVLLDYDLPGTREADVVRAVKQTNLQTSALVLSTRSDEEYVHAMLEAGVAGYLLKDELPQRIVEAVRAVARGECWYSRKIAALLAAWARGGTTQCKAKLTRREREVLRFVASGWRNQQIAEGLAISEVTVRFHLRNIYSKLGVQSRTQAAVWAIRNELENGRRRNPIGSDR